MVDGVTARKNKLGYGHKGIALLQQTFNNTGQGLRGVLGSVVEQNDGARAHLAGNSLGDVCGGQILPIQTVPTGSGWKALGDKGFQIRKQMISCR